MWKCSISRPARRQGQIYLPPVRVQGKIRQLLAVSDTDDNYATVADVPRLAPGMPTVQMARDLWTRPEPLAMADWF